MGRKRTGSPVEKDGVWYAQLTVDFLDGGSGMRNFPLPQSVRTKEQARAETRKLAATVAAKKMRFPRIGAALKAHGGLTFEAYLERWIEARRASGLKTVGKDRQRLTDHVLPLLRDRTMLEIEQDPDLLRDVIDSLDKRVALARAGTDPTVRKFEPSTAKKVWEAVTNLFGTAANGNDRSLRVLKTNPAKGLNGPKAGRDKEKQWLFPREFERLIACVDAPLAWRQAYAVATYLLLRVAELRALQCEDIDLDAGMVRVHRATKKDSVRHFKLEPEIIPVLRVLMARVGGKGRLFALPVERHVARGRAPQRDLIGAGKQAARLREHLMAAGARREALHKSTGQALQISFHDLRATGITWSAIRGDSMISIRDRAGHTDVDQTDEYVRRASQAGNVGTPFPSLGALLVGAGPSVHTTRGSTRGLAVEGGSLKATGTYEVEPRGIESLSGSQTTANAGLSDPPPCAKCAPKARPRNIPRDISGAERRGPTVMEQAAVWSLTCALEGLLARVEHQAHVGRPARAGAALAQTTAVAEAGPVPSRKRVSDVG